MLVEFEISIPWQKYLAIEELILDEGKDWKAKRTQKLEFLQIEKQNTALSRVKKRGKIYGAISR